MTILIPVDSKKRDECVISSIEENKAWAFEIGRASCRERVSLSV